MSLAYTILTTVNVALGYGRHTAVITDRLSLVLLLNNIDFLLGIMSFSLPKLAVVALLNRLFNPSLYHRIVLWGLTGLVALVSCICVIIIFTICDPPQAQWDTALLEKGATCRDRWPLVYYAIFNGGWLYHPIGCSFATKASFDAGSLSFSTVCVQWSRPCCLSGGACA